MSNRAEQKTEEERAAHRLEVRKAWIIGVICIFAYLVSYYLRKMLSVATIGITESGDYTDTVVGTLSTVYMVVYAAGQLVNGFLGDYLRPRLMISVGLLASAAAVIGFSVSRDVWFAILCFALLGLALSMLRGPMMKIISENTTPECARVICVFFSGASALGPFIASALVILFPWRWAFAVSGILAIVIAAVAFVAFAVMERRGMIRPLPISTERRRVTVKEILSVFRIKDYPFYLVISGLVETFTFSVVFWFPKYYYEQLGMSETQATGLFSVVTFVLGFAPFVSLFLFRVFRGRSILLTRVLFGISVAALLLMRVVTNPWANLAISLVALFQVYAVSAFLWSIYIPSLGKTGRVSSANGIMDCIGYLLAAVSGALFTFLRSVTDWNGMIYAWAAVALAGLIVSLCKRGEKGTDA